MQKLHQGVITNILISEFSQ